MTLQDLIHNLELGAGMRFINRSMGIGLGVIGLILLLGAYDLRAFRNFSTQEAMDTAQLARNLAQGKEKSGLLSSPRRRRTNATPSFTRA